MGNDDPRALSAKDKAELFDRFVEKLVDDPRKKRDSMITQNTRITLGTFLALLMAICGNIWIVAGWKGDIEAKNKETARDQIKGAHFAEWVSETERLNQVSRWHGADIRDVQAKVNQTQ